MQTTIRRKLSCTNCSQDFWVRSPADQFTLVTLKPCELSDYDISQTFECDNCHSQIILYWHNKDREGQQLLKIKKETETRNRAIMEILAFEKLFPTIVYYEIDLMTKILDHAPNIEASKKYARKIAEIYFEMENEIIAGLGLTGSEVKQIQKLAELRAKELLTKIKRRAKGGT